MPDFLNPSSRLEAYIFFSILASRSIEELNNSTALQSPSIRETKSVHVATVFPSGVPRRIQSLSVSLGPLNETESFPEESEITTTSAPVHSPSEAELRTNSGVIRNPGNRNFMEPSSKNGFGLTSSETSVRFWQNDSPSKYSILLDLLWTFKSWWIFWRHHFKTFAVSKKKVFP